YCLIDIKDFFVYNDKHGMEKGDEVLKTLGKTIKENIRANDTAVRIGGDEFVILLSNARGRESLHTIERIKEEMRSHDIYLHAGVADYHTLAKKEPSISYEDIHNYADDALRHSKHTGKTQSKKSLGLLGYLKGLVSSYKKRNLRARASH
ncbi:MAG: GGDEF domain-containing protein, partial [Candidatus Woesearchaeota archaeon]